MGNVLTLIGLARISNRPKKDTLIKGKGASFIHPGRQGGGREEGVVFFFKKKMTWILRQHVGAVGSH